MCGFFAGRRTLRLVKTWNCPKSIARTQPSLQKAHLDVQLYVWILPKENDTHTYHSRCAFPTLSLDFSPGKAHHFNKGIDLHHFGLIWKRSFSWCNEIFFMMIERPKPPQNASFCFPLLMCFCGWMVTNARHSNDVLYLYTRVCVFLGNLTGSYHAARRRGPWVQRRLLVRETLKGKTICRRAIRTPFA